MPLPSSPALPAAAALAAALTLASTGAASPEQTRVAAAIVSCGERELGGHIWSVKSTGIRTRPLPCSTAVGLVAGLSRNPVPAGGRPYARRGYRTQAAVGMRCFGGPAARKAPTSLTCAATDGNRRRTVHATCEWCRALFDGIGVVGRNTADPQVAARLRTLNCARTRGVFTARASRNGVTLELKIRGYRGPGFNDGVYAVPYGQIVTTITVEGPLGGSYANAHAPPNWEPGGPGGVIEFGENERGRATDRFLDMSMVVFDASRSLPVAVSGRAVCKYR